MPREEAMLWLRQGCAEEAPEASAACAQERGTTSETRGRGDRGEREGTGAVDAGCARGRGPRGAPAPADAEGRPAVGSKEEESERRPSGPFDQKRINQRLPLPTILQRLLR